MLNDNWIIHYRKDSGFNQFQPYKIPKRVSQVTVFSCKPNWNRLTSWWTKPIQHYNVVLHIINPFSASCSKLLLFRQLIALVLTTKSKETKHHVHPKHSKETEQKTAVDNKINYTLVWYTLYDLRPGNREDLFLQPWIPCRVWESCWKMVSLCWQVWHSGREGRVFLSRSAKFHCRLHPATKELHWRCA